MRFDIQGGVPSDAPGIWSPWPRGNMLWSSKVLVPGREVRSDSTGIVSSATRRPQRAKLPHVAYDTHGFVQSSQCLWPTLYQFPSCRRMRDLDHSRGPKACFTNRSATKGSSNTCGPPRPENSMRMGDFSCSVMSSELVATV